MFINRKVLVLGIAFVVAVGQLLAGAGNKRGAAGKATQAIINEADYDIKHLRFDLQLTDTSVYVAGNVATTATVVAASMSDYYFELDTVMTIDSAFINGTRYPVTTTGGFLRKITLPSALPAGAAFTARIYYRGTAPSGSGFFNGLTHARTGAGTHVVYNVSDPWVAKDWWPAKQSVNDQIDSVDMLVTVPRGVKDGSNGLLVNVDTVSRPGYATYHWHTNYPIDYYLISIAVARYAEYKTYWHLAGSSDSMLIQNFFLDTATFNPAFKANFDSVGHMIDYFSSLYGRYPFWKEKYGMCFTTLGGGMEHQTMTTIGVTDTRTIAHELAHQWWGDNVTYSRWGDVWLSEGFATFSEQLFYAHFWSPAKARALRLSYMATATSTTQACGQVFVTDTSGPNTLFDQATVYKKGQAVVTMLRYIAPSDSVFFEMLRDYQRTYAQGNAGTADLKAIAEAHYGVALDTFFNQWIYGKGYPRYTITWNQIGSSVFVKMIQQASCPATTPHFNTPLQLQLHNTTTDTFMKVYNSLDTQVFVFDWAPAVTSVLLNPDVWTICTLKTPIKRDTTLGISELAPGNIKVYPNPTQNYWQIEDLDDNTQLTLTDMTGRVLWQGKTIRRTTIIPGDKLPAGNYLLQLSGINGDSQIKLTHW